MRALWTLFKGLLGLLCVLGASFALFLLLGLRLPTRAAMPLAPSLLLLVALLGNHLFYKAWRRIDEDADWWENLPGVTALLCALLLGALGLWARGPLARALRTWPSRHAALGPATNRFAQRTLERLERLDPALREPVAPHADAGASDGAPRDAALADARALEAGPAAPPTDAGDASAPEASDAGALEAGDADAQDAQDAGDAESDGSTEAGTEVGTDAGASAEASAAGGTEGGSPAPAWAGVAELTVCSNGLQVWALPAGGGGRDGVLARCSDGLRVLRVSDEGGQELARFTPRQPEGTAIYLQDVAVGDLDHDGRQDVLLCTLGLSERGGTRPGGGVYWARQVGPLRFAAPTRLFAVDCAALAVGDVQGNGDVELVVSDWGNPYNPAHPTGWLRWYGGSGSRWTLLGSRDTQAEPEHLWLADSNGDGRLDAVIEHLARGQGGVVFPNTGRGFGPLDPSIPAVTPPEEHTQRVRARLDDDDAPDELAVGPGEVYLRRTQPFGDFSRALARAPEAQEFTF